MESNKQLSDTEIIERIITGEKPLFELIVRRYNPYLYKVGRSYNYNHEDTEDLMQETYVDAYKNLSKFESRSSFKTWIVRIMLNNCYHKKKKLSYKSELGEDAISDLKFQSINSINDTDKMVENKELNSVIEQALEKIPEDYRMVFALREMNGLNVSDTADLLKISENNVKVRLNRSKTMLRGHIENVYSSAHLYDFNLIYCDGIVDRVMRAIKDI
jgi:RNA polymerase sigma factor (sigma-70 family)